MLHQRHMLMRGSMQHDIRLMPCKDAVERRLIANGDNLHLDIQRNAVGNAKLLLDIIGAVFIHIEDDELFRLHLGNLPAQLAADRTAAAGNQHGLAAVIRQRTLIGKLKRLTEKQLLDIKLAQAAPAVFNRLRQRIVVHLQLAAGLLILIVQSLLALRLHLRQGEHDLLHREAHQPLLRGLRFRQNRDAVDRTADLLLIDIDKAAGSVGRARVVGQLLRQHHAHAARAHHGDIDLRRDMHAARRMNGRLFLDIRDAGGQPAKKRNRLRAALAV